MNLKPLKIILETLQVSREVCYSVYPCNTTVLLKPSPNKVELCVVRYF